MPFVEHPQAEPRDPTLVYCQDCQGWWWSDRAHRCPAGDQHDGEGIFLAVLGCAVIYAVLAAAGLNPLAWLPG